MQSYAFAFYTHHKYTYFFCRYFCALRCAYTYSCVCVCVLIFKVYLVYYGQGFYIFFNYIYLLFSHKLNMYIHVIEYGYEDTLIIWCYARTRHIYAQVKCCIYFKKGINCVRSNFPHFNTWINKFRDDRRASANFKMLFYFYKVLPFKG